MAPLAATPRSTSPVQEAASLAGLDARVASVAAKAEVSDLPAVLSRLVFVVAELDGGVRKLRSAGAYPLVLSLSVILAAVVVGGAALPTLAMLPGGPDLDLRGAIWWVAGLPAGLLLLLAAAVLGRLRIPWLSAGWAQLEGSAFVSAVDALSRSGASLPVALRAAAPLGGRAARAAAEQLAHSLEAGAPTDQARPLFDPFEATMLTAAASHGTLIEATGALAEQRRIALQRTIPDTLSRINVTALVLAGGAMLSIAATLFSVYGRVLAG